MLTLAVPGFNNPTAIVVIFAMLCSNPQIMNVKIQQKIMISFPDSDFILVLHQTAIQTRVLQRMPLQNSTSGADVIFFSAAAANSSPTVPVGTPDS